MHLGLGRIRSHMATKSGPRDRAIAHLAEAQHGVVAIWQLLELSMGQGAIKYQVASGRLHQLYRGVYAVGHTALSLNGRLIAAVFSVGANALLSHRSAAMLWGLLRDSRPITDVTTPDRDRKLIVELDSRAHHMTTRAFEEDRERDEVLQLAGYRVI